MHVDDKAITIEMTWSAGNAINMALRDAIESNERKEWDALDGKGVTADWDTWSREKYLEGVAEQKANLVGADRFMQQAWRDNNLPISPEGCRC